jgi:hypothetical protein
MRGGIIRIRDLQQLPHFRLHPRHPFHRSFTFMNENRMDYEWMEQQTAYMDGLTERQKHIVYAYTIYGDELMNQFLRGTLTQESAVRILQRARQQQENPLRYQHQDRTGRTEITEEDLANVLEYVPPFIEEFKEIIHNAPKLTRQIGVFRGIRDGQFIVDRLVRNENGTDYFHDPSFLSTTFYLPTATQFMDQAGDCCLFELILEPSVSCLLTAHFSRRRGEYEITVAPDTYMAFINCRYKLVLDQDEHYGSADVFRVPEQFEVVSKKRVCTCLLTTRAPVLPPS